MKKIDNTKQKEEADLKKSQKLDKKEIIYSAIVEKELLHNWLVQREQLKTLKELEKTMKDMTEVLKEFRDHQFLEIHKSKWKIILYNLSLGMLFAIWTVLGLMFLSWSTYHIFKDSTEIRNIINNQLRVRQFDLQEIKDKAKSDTTEKVWSWKNIIDTGSIKK